MHESLIVNATWSFRGVRYVSTLILIRGHVSESQIAIISITIPSPAESFEENFGEETVIQNS